jgi:WS/DGAT/MGAT family acyltransferase
MLSVVEFEHGADDDLVERASPIDMMELASDVGPVPLQVGAILVFAPGADLAASGVRDALADRIRGIPRLRQQLVSTPPGCGRPVWVDDPECDITRHVHDVRCPPPGDEEALLRVAAGAVTHPLPPDQPLWSATLVTGLAGDASALIVVFHHVLADGMGGLAVLASLVDGVASPPPSDFPRPKPCWRRLAQDAATARLHTLADLTGVPARLRAALAELRQGATPRAPRCSLNRPVGTRRRFGVARADLAQVRRVGHDHGGTVNDVVLAAVSGALSSLLAHRGERVDHVVVSVPISSRTEATIAQLGNQVGVIPVAIPTSGRPLDRLGSIARATREHKTGSRGASAFVGT